MSLLLMCSENLQSPSREHRAGAAGLLLCSIPILEVFDSIGIEATLCLLKNAQFATSHWSRCHR
ncbi:hypothetical protein Plhal304r1_c013g0049951 [Plasmopara halstedii]